jgi:Coenzyme PQQ synthesis protein D (PqqD)
MLSQMPLTLDSTIVVSQENLSSQLADEVVILNLANSTYYGLDPIGTRIWELIQTPQTVAKVLEHLLEDYDVEKSECERTLFDLLEDFRKHDLITLSTT